VGNWGISCPPPCLLLTPGVIGFNPPAQGVLSLPQTLAALTVVTPGVCASQWCDAPGVPAQPSSVARVPALRLRDGDGPRTAPASRSRLSTRLPAPALPAHAMRSHPLRPPRNHALLRGCRQHPEKQLCPKGDAAVTTMGTMETRWLHVQLPWMTTQALPKAEGTGMGLDGDQEGPAPPSLGAGHGDTACAALSPERATTSKGHRAPRQQRCTLTDACSPNRDFSS